MLDKFALRSELLARRARMSPYEVWVSSRSIFMKLIQEPVFKKAESICCYISYDNEVHTHGFILYCLRSGKTVVAPKVDKKRGIILSRFTDFEHLRPGTFGIPEPTEDNPYDPDKLDLVIVPAVALDFRGNRIGFGAGYYDKLLANRDDMLFLIGVVHDFQLLEQLPVYDHDIPMHQVITGSENIYRVTEEVN